MKDLTGGSIAKNIPQMARANRRRGVFPDMEFPD
jgi:hypothetical protein